MLVRWWEARCSGRPDIYKIFIYTYNYLLDLDSYFIWYYVTNCWYLCVQVCSRYKLPSKCRTVSYYTSRESSTAGLSSSRFSTACMYLQTAHTILLPSQLDQNRPVSLRQTSSHVSTSQSRARAPDHRVQTPHWRLYSAQRPFFVLLKVNRPTHRLPRWRVL